MGVNHKLIMARRQYLNFTILICCLLLPIFTQECRVDQYKCEVKGNCIDEEQICDGTGHGTDTVTTVDCEDNEEDEFTCIVNGEPKCLGPRKYCDGIQDCDNNEDEDSQDCCKHSKETNPCTGDKDGWFWCKCENKCIPPNEGDDPENPTSAVCNGKNDCCGTIHGLLAFSTECKDSVKTNYTALDEKQENGEACPIPLPASPTPIAGSPRPVQASPNPFPVTPQPSAGRPITPDVQYGFQPIQTVTGQPAQRPSQFSPQQQRPPQGFQFNPKYPTIPRRYRIDDQSNILKKLKFYYYFEH